VAALAMVLAADLAMAQPSGTQIGAWRYLETRDAKSGAVGYAALASTSANPKAAFGFRCDRQAGLSIYGVFVPGEPLGMPKSGELKHGLSVQVDAAPALNNDWFYPDENKGETEVTRSPGIDSFDILNAVRKGTKTVKVRTAKSDGKPVELSFDIRGAKEALNKLVADGKSTEYR
jgi:hypothetical protein